MNDNNNDSIRNHHHNDSKDNDNGDDESFGPPGLDWDGVADQISVVEKNASQSTTSTTATTATNEILSNTPITPRQKNTSFARGQRIVSVDDDNSNKDDQHGEDLCDIGDDNDDDNTRQTKKQRTSTSHQSTLTQMEFFGTKNENDTNPLVHQQEQVDGIWFVPKVRFELREFRQGDWWFSDYEKYRNKRFVLLSLDKKNNGSYWFECQELTRLEDTFIGHDANWLKTDTKWKKNNKFPKWVVRVDRSGKSPTSSICQDKLKDFDYRRSDPKKPYIPFRHIPSLYYSSQEETKFTVGMNIAYFYKTLAVPMRSPTIRQQQKKPVVLELFAGCGGMSLGLAKAGFHVKYAVEIDTHAAATLRANRSHHDCQGKMFVYQEDVDFFLENCKTKKIAYPKAYECREIDHIHASPPCQGFSQANRNGGQNDRDNNNLTFALLRALDYFKPKTFSLENVEGVLTRQGVTKKTTRIQYYNKAANQNELEQRIHWTMRVVSEALQKQYQVRIMILDAAHYGDPQNRNRVIIFGSQRSIPLPNAPIKTHEDPKEIQQQRRRRQQGCQQQQQFQKFKTAEQALGNLSQLQPDGGSGLVKVGDELIYHHNSDSVEIKGQEKEHDKLVAEFPSMTIRKDNNIKHYGHNRFLTPRERARLQSFPDDYEFCGDVSNINNQIGNAVPIKLATSIGNAIFEVYK